MRYFIALSLFTFTLTSCLEEEFVDVDPSDFNALIAERTDLETPEQLMMEYYGEPEHEGKLDLNISVKRKATTHRYVITLIHDKLLDDSQRATKIVMDALQQSNGAWQVQGIRKNWKCWEGRGHTDWSVEPCN